MDFTQILTWVMVIVGFIGFRFVGLKKWWAWYINLACQILWATYALVTGQPAFLASAAAYFVIFAWNAYKWTKDHLVVKKILKEMWENKSGTHILPGGVEVTYEYGVDRAKLFDVASLHPKEFNLDFADKPDEFHMEESDGMIIHNTKLDGSPVYTTPDMEQIARVCHEANRILQLSTGEEELSPTWDDATDDQRESTINGVERALAGISAEELHETWMEDRLAKGWVYGPVKSSADRTHPCLVPYLKLPEEQRIKDHMFRAIVEGFKADLKEKASVV
ncbi:hypothetical protein PBI_SHIBA_66 [Arthrobacter phage Shiba]|nr:hypothetical protein PBI_SHIBA_66 [Arthrobacter phage Shiba]